MPVLFQNLVGVNHSPGLHGRHLFSAVAGLDYEATAGTLNFGDGETSAEFEVTITGDSQSESDETVDLTLSNPSGGADLGDPNAAVLTIVNAVSPNRISGGGCALQASESVHPLGLAFVAALLPYGFAIPRIRRVP
ncbi:MAG: hypothetical protein K8R69_00830 [Deltaproteobacteria bacterium]|nr:hypothetical protein [Deltaproteobacteria bacterium]